MKRYIIPVFVLPLLMLASCSPDNNMASRMDGVWNITKAEVFYWDSVENDFIHDTTHINAGTVKLIDEGLKRNAIITICTAIPETSICRMERAPATITGVWMWAAPTMMLFALSS